MRHDEDLAQYIDYIVQNPVRAGLVKRASDYPYTRVLFPRRPDL